MPDDNQTTATPTTTDSATSGADNATSGASAGSDSSADLDMSGIDPNLAIPSLEDLEYATPSAYIDPNLPANPTPIEDPNEPKEEEKEPEETIEMTPEQIAEAIKASNAVMANVAERIAGARNILIAVSGDPSVDELAGAIALSKFLDRLGKHAIAIYSGATPNALEFLTPDQVFEKNADVLQDFVIALDKDKADHLRYKLDGDFVKIFITPYRDRIAAENLEFSYGDYNVDLVLSLNVNNGIDLDPALREYGSIMHDAAVVNITTGNPGKFGEVEWSNKFASSISEMLSDLLLSADGDTRLNAEEATALLAGIVAATDRFSRANTFSGTMQVASRLMDAGADQQLVAANISDDLDNQFFAFSEAKAKNALEPSSEEAEDNSFSFESPEESAAASPDDGSALQISHKEEQSDSTKESEDSDTEIDLTPDRQDESNEPNESDKPNTDVQDSNQDLNQASDQTQSQDVPEAPAENPGLLDELKATEASLFSVGAEVAPEPTNQPVQLESIDSAPVPNIPVAPTINTANTITENQPVASPTNKYSQMIEEAIAAPTTSSAPSMESSLPPVVNPATSSAPNITATPEVGAMPELNFGQNTNNDQLLPPPPAPPVDLSAPMPVPAPADLPPVANLGPEGVAPVEPTNPISPTNPSAAPAPDASAFTIPGV